MPDVNCECLYVVCMSTKISAHLSVASWEARTHLRRTNSTTWYSNLQYVLVCM